MSTITINKQPVYQPLYYSGDLLLSVDATDSGAGIVTYQWKRDGVAIPGETSFRFYRKMVDYNDNGSYTVTISCSGAADVTSDAVVIYEEPPISNYYPTTTTTTTTTTAAPTTTTTTTTTTLAP